MDVWNRLGILDYTVAVSAVPFDRDNGSFFAQSVSRVVAIVDDNGGSCIRYKPQ